MNKIDKKEEQDKMEEQDKKEEYKNTFNESEKDILIFDLDGTLIYSEISNEDPKNNDEFVVICDNGDRYLVKIRPGAKHIITESSKKYKLAVWTASDADYAKPIVSHLFGNLQLEFVYTRKNCSVDIVNGIKFIVKPLSLLKQYNQDKLLIIDDNPITYRHNYINAIPINTWTSSPEDNELVAVWGFICSFESSIIKECDLFMMA
jgi:TFIIF-interacting CTD phosphatase-like protein